MKVKYRICNAIIIISLSIITVIPVFRLRFLRLMPCFTNSVMTDEWPCRAAMCTGVIPSWNKNTWNTFFFFFPKKWPNKLWPYFHPGATLHSWWVAWPHQCDHPQWQRGVGSSPWYGSCKQKCTDSSGKYVNLLVLNIALIFPLKFDNYKPACGDNIFVKFEQFLKNTGGATFCCYVCWCIAILEKDRELWYICLKQGLLGINWCCTIFSNCLVCIGRYGQSSERLAAPWWWWWPGKAASAGTTSPHQAGQTGPPGGSGKKCQNIIFLRICFYISIVCILV